MHNNMIRRERSDFLLNEHEIDTHAYTYDSAGRVLLTMDDTAYSYDSNGRLTKISFSDGDIIEHEYNEDGKLLLSTWFSPAENYLVKEKSVSYTYSGQQLLRTHSVEYIDDRIESSTLDYKYDGARLVSLVRSSSITNRQNRATDYSQRSSFAH